MSCCKNNIFLLNLCKPTYCHEMNNTWQVISVSLTAFPLQSQMLWLKHRKRSRKYLWHISQQTIHHSFIRVRNRETPLAIHTGLSQSLLRGGECPKLSFQEQLWLWDHPGTRSCAAVSDIISPLEAFFPTERLALKSLFAAPDSKSDKPLTSSSFGLELLGSRIEGSLCKRTSGRVQQLFGRRAGRPRTLIPGMQSGKAATLTFSRENFARSLLLKFSLLYHWYPLRITYLILLL